MPIHFRRINWRLLALHLAGLPFTALGLRQLFLIRQVKFVRLRLQYGEEFWRHIDVKTTVSSALGSLILELQLLETHALLYAIVMACLLLGLIAWRRRESLLLPLLLFLGSVVLGRAGFLSDSFLLSFRKWLMGDVMADSVYYRLALSGGFFLLVGVVPFLLTWRRPDDTVQIEPY